MWTILQSLFNLLQYCFSLCLGFFARRHVDLSSLTRIEPTPPALESEVQHFLVSREVRPSLGLESLGIFASPSPLVSLLCPVWFHWKQLFLSFLAPLRALTWQGARGASLEEWRPAWGIPLGFTSRPLHSLLSGEGISSGFVRVLNLVQHALLSRTATGSLGFFPQGVPSGAPRCCFPSLSVCTDADALQALRLSVWPYSFAFLGSLGALSLVFFVCIVHQLLGFALYYLQRLKIRLPSHVSSQNLFLTDI